jgi:lysophospholipase L1-like esterase
MTSAQNKIVFAPASFYSRRMKNFSPQFFLAVASIIFLTTPKSFAQNTNAAGGTPPLSYQWNFNETNNPSFIVTNITDAVTNVAASNSATNPVPRDSAWVKRHEGFVAHAKTNRIDILFMGDSITDNWRSRGSNVWNQYYAPRHAANFGISGDRTQHVLWRMDNGELDGIKPKVVVLMIGTNNTKQNNRLVNSPPEIVEGVTAVVNEIRARLPKSKILLLGIFPRGKTLEDQQRAQVALVNTVIAKLDDGKMVRFLDIGPKFLEADGTISREIMPDALHPSAKGYQIWADAMNPTLNAMLK